MAAFSLHKHIDKSCKKSYNVGMFAAERSPHEAPQARDILSVIDELLPETAAELAYDEPQNGEEVRQIDVGRIWQVTPEDLRPGESVQICLCNEDGRYNLGAVLNKEHGIEALPLAFIELKSEQKTTSFTSMVYVLENGGLMALIDTYMVSEDALSEESEDCYDFAEQLGFGEQWTRAMFRSAEDGSESRMSELVTLNDEQKTRLHTFLNSLADRV